MSFFRLSQAHLTLLDLCPRKFQHIYLDKFASPTPPDQEYWQAWGKRFHLLMQQRELGLPIKPFLEQDPQLNRCFTSLIEAAPEIFHPASIQANEIFRQAEHRRTFWMETSGGISYLLTVIYDLLILEKAKAKIFDWKTYALPQNQKQLAQNWQTRLYRYVLAATSEYLPKQISMTYWFVQSRQETGPESLQFSYTMTQHKKTETDLMELLNQLTEWLQNYETGQSFPQVSPQSPQCQFCQFVNRCWPTPAEQAEAIALQKIPDLMEIPELAL